MKNSNLRKTSLFPSRQCAEDAHWLDGVVMGQDQLHSDEDQHLRIHGCDAQFEPCLSLGSDSRDPILQELEHVHQNILRQDETSTIINPCQMYSMCDSRSRTLGYTMLHYVTLLFQAAHAFSSSWICELG